MIQAIEKTIARAAKHERKDSEKPPNLFGSGDSDADDYMDDDALAKREERATKTRSESIATPDIYGDAQGESEEDDGSDDDNDNDNDNNKWLYTDEKALIKRQERSTKSHRRDSSIATPDIFRQHYDPEKVLYIYILRICV